MWKFIKNLVNNLKIINKKRKSFKELKVGDLVWAKMPLPKRKMEEIIPTHRVRPYLVVHKNKTSILAYQCSSKQCGKYNNYEEYFINKLRYDKPKDTWLNLKILYEVPIYNLKEKYIELNEFDLKNVQKRLKILYNRGNEDAFQLPVDIFILEGDVIKIDNQLYYVHSQDNASLHCIKMSYKVPYPNKKYERIIVNNKVYYTDFKEIFEFKRNIKMEIVDIAYKSEVETNERMKKGEAPLTRWVTKREKKEKERTEKVIYEAGTVFETPKGKLVYLFEHNGVHYGVDSVMYPICQTLIPIRNIDKKRILEIMPREEYIKIVETLSTNTTKPVKPIKQLYYEIRELVYS